MLFVANGDGMYEVGGIDIFSRVKERRHDIPDVFPAKMIQKPFVFFL